MKTQNYRAPRNRTLTLSPEDVTRLRPRLLAIDSVRRGENVVGKTIHGDSFALLPLLPQATIDLLVADPPYNLTKSYNGSTFKERSDTAYEQWLRSWVELTIPLLKPSASLYVCSEWRSSGVVQRILEEYFHVQNRITWEREKGRGALHNWKNCSEDIQYIGIELEETYCLLAERRLELAAVDPSIQGYAGGYFWERNTLKFQQVPL